MKILDKMLNFGSTFRLLLFTASLIILAIYIVSGSAQSGGAFVILFIGMIGTVREYRMWQASRRSRDEHTASGWNASEGSRG